MKMNSLVLILGLSIGFSSCVSKTSNPQITQTEPSVSPMVKTNESNSGKIAEQNGEMLISMDICNKKYSLWKSIVVADTVTIKIPTYIKQDPNYGGQTLDVRSSTFGHLSISTSLVGDFQPGGADTFEDKLQFLISSRNDAFVETQTYHDTDDRIFVKGNSFYSIAAKNSSPSRWWMFSTISQDQNKNSIEKQQAFMKSDDFNCMLRSISFN